MPYIAPKSSVKQNNSLVNSIPQGNNTSVLDNIPSSQSTKQPSQMEYTSSLPKNATSITTSPCVPLQSLENASSISSSIMPSNNNSNNNTSLLSPSPSLYSKLDNKKQSSNIKPISSYTDLKLSAYSPTISSSSQPPLSARFLSKKPRGYNPNRSSLTSSPTSPSSPESPSSFINLSSSGFSTDDSSSASEASSTSSSTSCSSLSLDNDPSLFSKLTHAVQAMALANESKNCTESIPEEPVSNSTGKSFTTNIPSDSTTSLSTLTPSTPNNFESSTCLPQHDNISTSNDIINNATYKNIIDSVSKSEPSTPERKESNQSSNSAPLPTLLTFEDISPANIIRKKSGERVKSSLKLPSLARPSSMPSTPSKMVHFDTNLEHVRHFLHSERPAAVSADSSPAEERPKFHWGTDDSESGSESDESEEEEDPRLGFQRFLSRSEWKIDTPNFRHLSTEEMQSKNVFMESIFLSSDKENLVGHIAVRNLAFQKYVCIRYSIDYWKTFTEVQADFNDDVRRKKKLNGFDRFTFAIKLSDLPYHTLVAKSMYLCIRYVTCGQEFWDNNDNQNYKIDFTRVSKSKEKFSFTSNKTYNVNSRVSGRYHHRRSKSSSDLSRYGRKDDFSSDNNNINNNNNNNNNTDNNTNSNTNKPDTQRVFNKRPIRMDSEYNRDFDSLSSSVSSVEDILDDLTAPKLKKKSSHKDRDAFTSRYSFGNSFNATRSQNKGHNPSSSITLGTLNYNRESSESSDSSDDNLSSGRYFNPFNPSASSQYPKTNNAYNSQPTTQLPSSEKFGNPIRTNQTGSVSNKLALNAASYQELIHNYCFFQGPSTKPAPLSSSSSSSSTDGLFQKSSDKDTKIQTNGSTKTDTKTSKSNDENLKPFSFDGTRDSVREWPQQQLSV